MSEFVTDPAILSLANGVFKKFAAGEMDMNKLTTQLAISSGSAQDIFYEALDECEDTFYMSAREFVLDFVKLKCSSERLSRILRKQEKIQYAELSDWLFEIEDTSFNGMHSYWFVPIKSIQSNQAWIIIMQDGAPLDPEYSIVGVFASKSHADQYFKKNYDF